MSQQHNLAALPEELLISIFQELPWRSAQPLSLVCRRFCELCQSPELWAAYASRHCNFQGSYRPFASWRDWFKDSVSWSGPLVLAGSQTLNVELGTFRSVQRAPFYHLELRFKHSECLPRIVDSVTAPSFFDGRITVSIQIQLGRPAAYAPSNSFYLPPKSEDFATTPDGSAKYNICCNISPEWWCSTERERNIAFYCQSDWKQLALWYRIVPASTSAPEPPTHEVYSVRSWPHTIGY
eukprot:gnl/Spiro4/13311_TR7079_c0_g1_i1.p1 gnl/Spiro4/13311_TR7079_c0_g1~~gnl/Spiro4/13311_TR7079_c0_g1_i1.p1  ORF type:complete len:238 (+),score=35.87 gnl/Spiro4/13311_TR7079_c0_g1_i1:77-790(+)